MDSAPKKRFNNCLQTDEGLYPGPGRAWRPCVLSLHQMVMGEARLQQEKLLTLTHSGHKPVALGCSRLSGWELLHLGEGKEER